MRHFKIKLIPYIFKRQRKVLMITEVQNLGFVDIQSHIPVNV